MKENKNNIDNQDQDYGFPFVELVPLNDFTADLVEGIEIEENVETPEEVESQVILTDLIASTNNEEKPAAQIIEAKNRFNDPKSEEKKKSATPLILGLILLLFAVLGSMAYFLYYVPNADKDKTSDAIESTQTQEETPSIVSEELTANDIIEEEVVEVELEEEEIAVTSSEPELTIINSREANPRYFIVVGSVVAERYAREEVKQYLEKGYNSWIIFPYGDIKNYRIAVGKFDNIETATEAWEKAKGEFGDAIWILKY
ncbi:SPOR domain-containing protein [Belliella sp. DSM 107340]|uniref:SPOR domain-containing protein n=1 Tax=Belliella calami TaxID=2923436 RepID=A0ABS9US60_9BACT|nr:SPOR domain-containing protein [Belliella calami]MCH7399456.1 SPOR domain-containing protein [Belliella calami]